MQFGEVPLWHDLPNRERRDLDPCIFTPQAPPAVVERPNHQTMTVEAIPTQSVPAHIEMILDEVPCPLCASERRHTAADGLINFLNRADTRRYSFSECDECGLAYLNPRPRNLDAVYPDDYSKHQANA